MSSAFTASRAFLFSIFAALLVLCSCEVLAQAVSQTLNQRLVGTWMLVSAHDTQKDGTDINRWGDNPKGSLMFDANGRYMFLISRSDIPKFAAKSVNEGSSEENKAVVRGIIAHFGSYTIISEPDRIVTHVEESSFPNINGTDQIRIIRTLTADELVYDNPISTTGAASRVVWKRVK